MNKTISIYTILKCANMFVFGLMLLVYWNEGDTESINSGSIWLGALLVLITHLVLLDASKYQNPLLVLMALVMIAYFELRIVTLNYTDYSVVFSSRVKLPEAGVNYSLIFILLAYICAWVALRYRKNRIVSPGNETIYKKNASKNILIFLYISLTLSVASSFNIPGVSQIIGILSTFFLNMFFMMLYAMVFFMYKKQIKKKERLAFLVFLFLFVALFTILGSRSTFLKIVMTTMFAMLVINKVRIKVVYVWGFVLIIPIAAYFFILSTFTRGLDAKHMTRQEQMEIFSMVSNRINGNDIKIVLSPIFDRMGYLDYATEMIYNRPHLSQYLNIPNYGKSVVDNLLTPGFNIFDMPKMSNVISKSYIYKGEPSLSKYGVSGEDYQSDVITFWGEMYLLFGVIFALPAVFVVCTFVKSFFVKHSGKSSICDHWICAVIIYEFYTLLMSMGLDWIVIDLTAFTLNYLVFKKITVDTKKEKLYLKRNGL